MATIPEYTAQAELTPSDKGIQAAEVAGRRIGMYGHQIEGDADQLAQKIDQHDTNMEVSHGSAIGATAYSGFTTSLNAVVTSADPNDQSAVPKWRQAVFEPWADSFVQNFKTKGGQTWARNYVDSMRQHFTEAAISDQSTLAGAAARQNYAQTKQGLSSTVFQDPTALNATLAALDATIDHVKSQPNLDARDLASIEEDRVASRGQLAESAVRGMIVSGQPGIDMARKYLADPTWMSDELSGEQRDLLEGKADEQERLLQDQARVGAAQAKAQTEEDTKAQIAQVRASLLPSPDGTPPDAAAAGTALTRLRTLMTSTNPVVAATAGAEAESISSVIRTQAEDRLSGKLIVDDPAALASINQAVGIAPGQPGALTKLMLDDMRIAGRINDKTYAEQTKRLDDLTNNPELRQAEGRLTDFMRTAIEPKLTHGAAHPTGIVVNPTGIVADLSGSTVDPRGKAAFGIALNQTMSQFETLIHNGHSVDEAYKMLTDPGSSNSVWNTMPYWSQIAANGPGWAAQHPTTFGSAPAGSPNAAPTLSSDTAKVQAAGAIKPGESWAAYKARAGIN